MSLLYTEHAQIDNNTLLSKQSVVPSYEYNEFHSKPCWKYWSVHNFQETRVPRMATKWNSILWVKPSKIYQLYIAFTIIFFDENVIDQVRSGQITLSWPSQLAPLSIFSLFPPKSTNSLFINVIFFHRK